MRLIDCLIDSLIDSLNRSDYNSGPSDRFRDVDVVDWLLDWLIDWTEVIVTTDLQTAFKDVDVVLLMASVKTISPERQLPYEGMDTLQSHIPIYKQHAEALNLYAKKTVKVLCSFHLHLQWGFWNTHRVFTLVCWLHGILPQGALPLCGPCVSQPSSKWVPSVWSLWSTSEISVQATIFTLSTLLAWPHFLCCIHDMLNFKFAFCV